ncbi:MAG: glycosyltransferase family 2 protein [Lautropia sp.]|nr:glycosyltransferase family 2 protein [Lautropia sp.]
MPESAVPGGLSVAIITKNEAHRIAACLQSVAFADQIVVLDSGSTDDTVAIARNLGAEVEVTPDWPGFGPQKNRALARCTQRWVLSIDADEQLSEALAHEIVQVLRAQDAISSAHGPASAERGGKDSARPGTAEVPGSSPVVAGYWLRRSSSFCGQAIRHGLWGNDRVLRLFERRKGRFSDDRVHERLICDGPTRVLDGMLLHDSVDSLEDALGKSRQYAWLGAEKVRARKGGGLLSACLHGGWSFVRGYLLRAGFLDGRNGLRLAWLHAKSTYWKYRWAGLSDTAWQAQAQLVSSRR